MNSMINLSEVNKSWMDFMESFTTQNESKLDSFKKIFNTESELFDQWQDFMKSLSIASESNVKKLGDILEKSNISGMSNDFFTKNNSNIQDFIESANKNTVILKEIFEISQNSQNKLTNICFEVTDSLSKGDKVDIEKISKNVKDIYQETITNILKKFEKTPFEEVKQVVDAMKNSINSFVDEQKVLGSMLQVNMDCANKTTSLIKNLITETQTMNMNLMKGEIAPIDKAFKQTVESYYGLINTTFNILNPLVEYKPELKDPVENLAGWARKNTQINSSWLKLNMNAHNQFISEGQDLTVQKFSEIWTKILEKAKVDFKNQPLSFMLIADSIKNNSEYLKHLIEMVHSKKITVQANGYKEKETPELLVKKAA